MSGSVPRSSASAPDGDFLEVNIDSRSWPKPAEDPPQVATRERDAARGRRTIRPRKVQEHRAAAPGHPRSGIVVDLDDQVVKGVVAPEPVAWFIGRPPERPVVAPIPGIFTPSHLRVDAPGGQERARLGVAIGPPP